MNVFEKKLITNKNRKETSKSKNLNDYLVKLKLNVRFYLIYKFLIMNENLLSQLISDLIFYIKK